MVLLASADSRMPRTRITVRIITIKKRRHVEAEVKPGRVEHVALQISQPGWQIGGRDPAQSGMPAEPVEHADQMRGKADAHRHVADGVFEDQVPTDDPGNEFAHGGVGVGVRAARDGNHRSELCITEPGKAADDRHQNQRKRQRRTGAGASHRGMWRIR